MQSGYQPFSENFKDCCLHSSGRLAYEETQNCEKFIAASQENDARYAKIKAKLGEESRLLNDFEATKNYLAGLEIDYVYQQGFQDCIYLLHWLKLL